MWFRTTSRGKVSLASLLLTPAVVVILIGTTSPASACSFGDLFEVPFTYFAEADSIEALNEQLSEDFEAWVNGRSWGTRPTTDIKINFVVRERSVLTVEPSGGVVQDGNSRYTEISIAGATFEELVWGRPNSEPELSIWHFDTSSCAGSSEPPPIGETRWLMGMTPDNEPLAYGFAVDDVATAEETLTRLFGEPKRTDRSQADEDAALTSILETGTESGIDDISAVNRLDIETGVTSTEAGATSTEDPNSRPWLAIAGVSSLAVVAIVVLALRSKHTSR